MADKKPSESMMRMLRARRGLADIDTSQDKEILAMRPSKMVKECTAWHLGDGEWAGAIATWMDIVGAKPEDF